MKTYHIAATIAKETEKAVQLNLEAVSPNGHQYRTFSFWFPKSTLTEVAPFPTQTTAGTPDVLRYYQVADWKAKQTEWNGWEPNWQF